MLFVKRLLILLALLIVVAGVSAAVLYQKGYFSDPQIALRELERKGIAPEAASVLGAAQRGDAAGLERLARAGVDLQVRDEDGRTPLLLALTGKHVACLPILEKEGWNLDARDKSGNTPLSLALRHDLRSLAEKLISEGASANFMLPSGELALPGYFRAGRFDDFRFLLQSGANPDSPALDGQTVLAMALQKNQPVLACKLLEKGADPNGKVLGEPLLSALIVHGPSWGMTSADLLRVMGTLLLSGADPEAPMSDGRRPIQLALAGEEEEVLNLVLPRVTNFSDSLWIAIQGGRTKTLKALFAKGVSPEETGPQGESPLLHAIRNDDILLIQSLLDAGADPNQLGPEGQPALFVAIVLRKTEAALAMLSHANSPDIARVMETPVSEEFRDLYQRKGLLDWYCRNDSGLLPIAVATMMRELPVTEKLIVAGADRFQKTTGGDFPIQMAAKNADVQMQQLLIGVPYEDDQQVRNFIIDLSSQNVTYYKDGEKIKTSRISTGRSGYRTPPGDYVITDKTRHKRSNIYDNAEMPYFQRFSCTAIGFHEGNTGSRFASHGCIRLPRATARFFWNETKTGDRVTIQK